MQLRPPARISRQGGKSFSLEMSRLRLGVRADLQIPSRLVTARAGPNQSRLPRERLFNLLRLAPSPAPKAESELA